MQVEEAAPEDVGAMMDIEASSDEEGFEGLGGSDSEDEEDVVAPAPLPLGWNPTAAPQDRAPNWLPQLSRTPGVTLDVGDKEHVTPKTCLDMFVTDAVIEVAVDETNRYAGQRLEKIGDRVPSARIRKWVPTTEKEFRVLFVMLIAMGIVTQPSMADHWTTDWLLKTPGFPMIMPRNRFQLLLSCLHFTNNTTIARDESGRQIDPLAKIRKFMQLILDRFRCVYYQEYIAPQSVQRRSSSA